VVAGGVDLQHAGIPRCGNDLRRVAVHWRLGVGDEDAAGAPAGAGTQREGVWLAREAPVVDGVLPVVLRIALFQARLHRDLEGADGLTEERDTLGGCSDNERGVDGAQRCKGTAEGAGIAQRLRLADANAPAATVESSTSITRLVTVHHWLKPTERMMRAKSPL